MKSITLSVSQLVEGYSCNALETQVAVTAMNGKLTLRPAYQREFVYDTQKQGAVIDTILMDCPLGVAYFVENADGTYECLDGQQRLTSICEFVKNESIIPIEGKGKTYETLSPNKQIFIMSYNKIIIYVLTGEEAADKLNWFERINLGGMSLTNQEMLNALYNGPFVTAMRSAYASNSSIRAGVWALYDKVIKLKDINRQTGVEFALKIANKDNNDVKSILSTHRMSSDISFVNSRMRNVFDWAMKVTSKIKPCKEIQLNEKWEDLYEEFGFDTFSPEAIAETFNTLMADEEVTNKKGIIWYALDPAKYANKLSLRAFSESDMKSVYTKQDGICPICGKKYNFDEMAGDHIIPWSRGGKTTIDNLQMLCRHCNSVKSNN